MMIDSSSRDYHGGKGMGNKSELKGGHMHIDSGNLGRIVCNVEHVSK